jgi:hypothetical protein
MKRITLSLNSTDANVPAPRVKAWIVAPGLAVNHTLTGNKLRAADSIMESKYWTVTHIATGLAIKVWIPKRQRAVDFALKLHALAEASGHSWDEFTSVAAPDWAVQVYRQTR